MFKIAKVLYKRLVEPKSEKEDLKRREFILNFLLLCVLVLCSIGLLLAIYYLIVLPGYNGLPLGVFFAIFLVFLILYLLSRSGYPVISAHMFVVIFFVSTIYATYKWGVELPPALLFYVLLIIMSGVLIGSSFAFIITLISSLLITVFGYTQIYKITHPVLDWRIETLKFSDIAMFSVTFVIIATVSWLSNREIEKSLKRARKSEAELKKERDSLEVKVEERTKELKKVQMEKMSQLYRFAEFGRLSSGLFHDLINPLTAVSLNIEKIKHSQRQKIAEVKSYLSKAITATKRMENFIMAVRKQMAKQENKTLFSLTEEIKQIIQILSYKARKKNVKVTFLPIADIQTYGDSVKFSQIVTNLITNAIDAYVKVEKQTSEHLYPPVFASGQTSPGYKKPEVQINLGEKGDIIHLTVGDWGCGIPKEIIDKIFQPFFTTKDFRGGMGIGLPLIKNIIEKDLHGTIEVESEVNKGTKFIIKFPKKYGNKKEQNYRRLS